MINLGRSLRRKYIEEHKLLDPTYNPSELFVRSTESRRTIESAQSFFVGMFPNLKVISTKVSLPSLLARGTISPFKSYVRHQRTTYQERYQYRCTSRTITKLSTIIYTFSYYYYSIQDDLSKQITIYTKERNRENMYPRSSCQRLNELRDEVKQSREWKDKQREMEPIRKQLQRELSAHNNYPRRYVISILLSNNPLQ